MRLTKQGDRFIAVSTFHEKDIPKQAGFRWDPALKQWWTDSADKASALADFADADIQPALLSKRNERDTARTASRKVITDFVPPAPEGLVYKPFQCSGVEALTRMKRAILADQMRLGKTIQAIGWVNVWLDEQRAEHGHPKVLVIPPAYLKLNWAKEMSKWFIVPMRLNIITGKSEHTEPGHNDVTIINYDILKAHKADVLPVRWDFIFIDEAHYLKNKKTQRFQHCEEIINHNPQAHVALITGTPFVNFPIELFQLLTLVMPETYNAKTFFRYAKRYCNATQKEVVIGWDRIKRQKITRMVWDMKGSSNLSELQNELRATCMIRRMRKDVLTEGGKKRQLIMISRDGQKAEPLAVQFAEAKIARDTATTKEEYEAAAARMDRCKVSFVEMSALRREIGLAKVEYAVEYIKNALDEDPEEKVVVFGWHQEVIDQVEKELSEYGVVKVTGATPLPKRDEYRHQFMTNPKIRVFDGNMQAAGVGINLSKANLAVFVEEDYVPGNVDQAEDRIIDMEKTEPCFIVHFGIDGTLDANMIQEMIAKQDSIDQATTIKGKEETRDLTAHFRELDRQATAKLESIDQAKTKRAEVLEEFHLSDEKIAAIHSMLRILAGTDTDFARERNDIGFNKVDGRFGHELAGRETLSPKQAFYGAKLLRKYRRQLPEHLYELVFSSDDNHNL